MTYNMQKDIITAGAKTLLEGVSGGISLMEDALGCGVFLHAECSSGGRFWSVPLGRIADIERFTACARCESTFWMEPCVGGKSDPIPGDVQWLMVRRTDGSFMIIVPIMDGALRFCLGGRDGVLRLWADSGDAWTTQSSGIGAFLAVGDDPYSLQEQGSAAVARRLGTGRLRREKDLPDFIDFFGWCTWDAFYKNVTESDVMRGMKSFAEGGLVPKFVILDDGWLSVQKEPGDGIRLTDFKANEKFPGGLAPLIAQMKRDFKVECFMVWHAVMGYWAGIDKGRFSEYDVQETPRNDMPPFGRDMALAFCWLGTLCGVIPPESIAKFYDDFHTFLASEGVDGVKVDNQSSIELSALGLGGRVNLSQAYRRGLESSCMKNFKGRLINCMSGSSEMYLMARDSNIMRTSDDFWPNRPETHGKHLYTNSMAGMWFGQFIHPDWDMFQSGHKMGSFHAAARAISGSPVYVSDKPECHDFEVMRKLVCQDGKVLRCTDIGRPAQDCLFNDPTKEDILLKIFNFNENGAVIGVFHAKHANGTSHEITGTISPSDIPSLSDGDYAAFSHRTGKISIMRLGDRLDIALAPAEWDIFTFVPAYENTAVIGLSDKYNTGATISGLQNEDRRTTFNVRDKGTLVMYAVCSPKAVTLDGAMLDVIHSKTSGKVLVDIVAAGKVSVAWR